MSGIQQWFDRFYLALDRRLWGWPTLLIRTGLAFDQDDGAVVSRSMAYYALFSLFPLLLVLLSVLNPLAILGVSEDLIFELMESYMPIILDLIADNLEQIAATQSTINILALVGVIWSATGVFTAMYRAVNRAWNNPKSKLFWKEKLFGLAVVFAIGLLLLATTFFSVLISVVQSRGLAFLNWQPWAEPQSARLWVWFSQLLPPVISVIAFITLYRIIPHNPVRWRDVWLGGLITGIVWEGARRIYTWYLANVAAYNLIYGSVGAIIGFLLWSYLSAMILLIGAEFTAQHTWWRKDDCPIETRPLSQWMDDWSKRTLPASQVKLNRGE